jgi:hypothetical protein
MELVILLVVCMGVFLVWRIYKVMEFRAKVEVAAIVATAEVNKQVAKFAPIGAEFEQAKREKRLLEWVEKFGHAMETEFDASYNEVGRQVKNDPTISSALHAEAAERGIPCKYLVSEWDYKQYYENAHYPGDPPKESRICSALCDGQHMFTRDLDQKYLSCPFCGEPVEIDPVEPKALADWQAEMRQWNEFKKRFPEKAAPREAEHRAAIAQADAKYQAEFEVAILAAKSKNPPS